MQYPIWQLGSLGGGFLIALIAVTHVYVAHFAVGGGLFLVLAEIMARKDGRPAALAYVKSHAKFFLLLTMVFGGVSGVGIWLIISLLSPGATSVLVHEFVFAWATEWTFFITEIAALLIYYYGFERMRPADHQRVGWIYFGAAFMSLFIITGIIGVMLTPGEWLTTGDFWDGFFNPSFWPQVVLRTALAFIFAGIFGLLTATYISDPDLRQKIASRCAIWLVAPMFVLAGSAMWSMATIGQGPTDMILGRNPEIRLYLESFLWLSPILAALGLLAALRTPSGLRRSLAWILVAGGLLYMGAYEYLRESARRPWVIYGHTYSNGLRPADIAKADAEGFLKNAPWAGISEVTGANRLEAGRALFNYQCASCHSIGGIQKDILPLTERFNQFGMEAAIRGCGTVSEYMPPFAGTQAELSALAAYIVEGLHHRKPAADPGFVHPEPKVEIPPFDPDKDQYVLLAWNNLGMHCMSDADAYWTLLPPANDLYCQLIRRDDPPSIVTEDVEITYAVEPGFENPSRHVDFWKHAASLFGKALPENVGLSGNGVSGHMEFDDSLRAFKAELIPVVPYQGDEGKFNPYPVFTVQAKSKSTGQVLATTKVVAPTSTEMGCGNCHGNGEWRVQNVAGFTAKTAMDVLAVHDRRNKTNLLAEAKAGKPRLCQSCHPDPVLKSEGRPGLLNLPAAIHGFHAPLVKGLGAEACAACHPASPKGPTRCLRGVHNTAGLDCTNCHGEMADHTLSLLTAEHKASKPTAYRLMRNLKPVAVSKVEEINPRTPWLMEPDCLTCHVGFEPPQSASAFNTWTSDAKGLYRFRSDDMGVMCAACHNSPHAEYPATNPYGLDRDNLGPLQYQKEPYPIAANRKCVTCHTSAKTDSMHHPDMLKDFRMTR